MKIRESMTRVAVGNVVVRVWRDEPLDASYEDIVKSRREVNDFVLDIIHQPHDLKSSESRIAEIGEMERVSAVEILDKDGNGSLLYPRWP